MTSSGRDRCAARGRLAAVAVALACGPLLAGCGGGDAADLTRSDFIADADAICAQANAEAAARKRDFNQAIKSSDLEQAAKDFEDQANQVAATLDELEGLQPPEADATTVAEIVGLGRKRVKAAQEAADAIASGDKDAMIAAGKRGAVLAGQYDQLASGYGFEACAGLGSGSSGAPAGATGGAGANS